MSFKENELIRGKEGATLLGVHRETLRRMTAKGIGPTYYQIGARKYYRRNEVLAWIESRRVESRREIKQQRRDLGLAPDARPS